MAKKIKDDDGVLDAFPKKYLKRIQSLPGYIESADSKSTEELEKEIVKCRGSIEDVEKDLENDLKVKALKQDLQDITGAFKDAQGMEDAKVRYCLFILRQRGAR